MAFVGSTVGYSAAGTYTLPLMRDISGNTDPCTLFSHLQSSGGGTIAFDNAPAFVLTVPAAPLVVAIPPAARALIMTGTASIVLGRNAG